MDRLDCDRMLVAVMESGSFSAAAERLGTSSGRASKLIAKLESELGCNCSSAAPGALSHRSGPAYFDRVKNILEDFDALDASVRHASGKPSGG